MVSAEQNMLHSLEEIKERLEHIETRMRDLFEVRPEYLKKLEGIEKRGKFRRYSNIGELRKAIEK